MPATTGSGESRLMTAKVRARARDESRSSRCCCCCLTSASGVSDSTLAVLISVAGVGRASVDGERRLDGHRIARAEGCRSGRGTASTQAPVLPTNVTPAGSGSSTLTFIAAPAPGS